MAAVTADELRDELRARLKPAGWTLLDPESAAAVDEDWSNTLARLTRPLDENFMATAVVRGSIDKAKREAIKAVERVADGKTAPSCAQLSRMSSPPWGTEDPVRVEQQVDRLLDPQALGRQSVDALRRVGRGIQTAIRDRALPDGIAR